MHLPKGSLILPNIWYMLHDPEFYPNPDEFNPDRYSNLDSEMDKVTDLVFGFGRRVFTRKTLRRRNFFRHRGHCYSYLRDLACCRYERKQSYPQCHIFVRNHHLPVGIRYQLAVPVPEIT
ncbi:hypothetical protein DFH09DRAFT_330142 [Mycena vulgaris]|nr:hypothetical protein DFH09DRAFT_330142 [Mycena vulgaris]